MRRPEAGLDFKVLLELAEAMPVGERRSRIVEALEQSPGE